MNKRQRKKKDKKIINSPDSTFTYIDVGPSLTLEKLKAATKMFKPLKGELKIAFFLTLSKKIMSTSTI